MPQFANGGGADRVIQMDHAAAGRGGDEQMIWELLEANALSPQLGLSGHCGRPPR